MKPLTESQIQKKCVEWFGIRYPNIKSLLFAVPNGGARNKWTGKVLKDEGVRTGVADLILLLPHAGFASLCIEMKKAGGKQSESQIEWEKLVTKAKNKYALCHSLEEFVKVISEYLK